MFQSTPMQKKETGNAKARAYFSPACFKMDAYVLRSRSPPCIGTVSFPGFVGCTICRCEPFCAFFSQPSAFRICRISFAVTLSPPVFIITRIMRIVNICCKYKCKLSMYSAALLILAGFNQTAFYPSYVDPDSSLTIYNASSSLYTLKAMSYVSIIIPVVIAYIWYAWRTMTRKAIDKQELEESENKY